MFIVRGVPHVLDEFCCECAHLEEDGSMVGSYRPRIVQTCFDIDVGLKRQFSSITIDSNKLFEVAMAKSVARVTIIMRHRPHSISMCFYSQRFYICP